MHYDYYIYDYIKNTPNREIIGGGYFFETYNSMKM